MDKSVSPEQSVAEPEQNSAAPEVEEPTPQDQYGNAAILAWLADGLDDAGELGDDQVQLLAIAQSEFQDFGSNYEKSAFQDMYNDLSFAKDTLALLEEVGVDREDLREDYTPDAGDAKAVEYPEVRRMLWALGSTLADDSLQLHDGAIQAVQDGALGAFDKGVPELYLPDIRPTDYPHGPGRMKWFVGEDWPSYQDRLVLETERIVDDAPRSGDNSWEVQATSLATYAEVDALRGKVWQHMVRELSRPENEVHEDLLEMLRDGELRADGEAARERELLMVNLDRERGEGPLDFRDLMTEEQLVDLRTRAENIHGTCTEGGDRNPDIINPALRGLDRYELDVLRRMLRAEGTNLDFVLGMAKNSWGALQEAELRASLSGDKVSAAIAALEEAAEWDNTEKKVREVLGALSAEEREEFARRVEDSERYRLVIDDLNREWYEAGADVAAEVFGEEAGEFVDDVNGYVNAGDLVFGDEHLGEEAEAYVNNDEDRAKAYHLLSKLDNPGTSVDQLRPLLKPAFLTDRVRDAFEEIAKMTVEAKLEEEALMWMLSEGDQMELAGLGSGDQAMARAGKLVDALSNKLQFDHDTDELYSTADAGDTLAALEHQDAEWGCAAGLEEQQAMEEHFSTATGDQLGSELDLHFGAVDAELMEELIRNKGGYGKENRTHNSRVAMEQARRFGSAHPARRIFLYSHAKKDGGEVVGALTGKSLAEITVLGETWDRLFDGSMQADLVERFDGKHGLDIRLALLGSDPSPDGILEGAHLMLDYSGEAWFETAGLRAERYREIHQRLVEATRGRETHSWADFTDEEKAYILGESAALAVAHDSWEAARAEMSEAITSGFEITVSALATFVTGGAAAPWIVAAITGIGNVVLKAAIEGAAYDDEMIGRDLVLAALSAALETKMAGKYLDEFAEVFGSEATQVLVKALVKTGVKTVTEEGLDAAGLGDGSFNADKILLALFSTALTVKAKKFMGDWIRDPSTSFDGGGKAMLEELAGASAEALAKTLEEGGKTPYDLLKTFVSLGGRAMIDGLVDHFNSVGLTIDDAMRAMEVSDHPYLLEVTHREEALRAAGWSEDAIDRELWSPVMRQILEDRALDAVIIEVIVTNDATALDGETYNALRYVERAQRDGATDAEIIAGAPEGQQAYVQQVLADDTMIGGRASAALNGLEESSSVYRYEDARAFVDAGMRLGNSPQQILDAAPSDIAAEVEAVLERDEGAVHLDYPDYGTPKADTLL